MVLMEPIQVQPIGYVRNDLGRRRYNEWRGTESQIVISEEYRDALHRLDEYSHIEVLFYVHEMKSHFRTRIHPTGNPAYPEMGAFATRTPNRPSKIALTTCRIESIEDNVIRVKGLDAYDGSPVLDVKPHAWKISGEVRVPDWIAGLHREMET
ncbi:MAG: tRNA (N6-threonylcarbamoyladenosine(37)-N6)-methyltransferase TrmO [Deltaproteobacteria bacterium]|nr:tRNA (N6-threonylcarbamoyladenosine(37)-N6)-methyltransferase TrmO [Deltaproteobacteria bacterium]